jgi:hypothetical protein
LSTVATREIVVQDETGYEHSGHVPDIEKMTREQRLAAIEELTANDEKFGLQHVWKRYLGDLHRSIQEDAYLDQRAKFDAETAAGEASAELEHLYEQVPDKLIELLNLVDSIRATRATYETAWAVAAKLGEAPDRLQRFLDRGPSDYDAKILIDRFRAAASGW